MEPIQIDLNNICRTCKATSSQMHYLYGQNENNKQNPRIDEMLMACTSINVENGDGFSSLICQACLDQLNAAFGFKRQCEEVDASLKEYARNLKVIEIKQELQNSDFMVDSLNNLFDTETTINKGENANSTAVPARTEPSQTKQDFIQLLENKQLILTCHECLKVFTTLEGLRWHKRVHAGSMFKCKQCDKEYTRLNHLQRHELLHGRRKMHVCKICNKTLMRMEHLKRHLATHLKDKPFSCKTCNRGFNRLDHLQNHTPKCKGENVLTCRICNRVFFREDSLELHMKGHENKKPELPTLENLNNLEDHYYEIEYDPNVNFSDASDGDDDNQADVSNTEDHIDNNSNTSDNKQSDYAEENLGLVSEPNILINEIDEENTSSERVIIEISKDNQESENEEKENESKLELKQEDVVSTFGIQNMLEEGDSDSADSEYVPGKLSPLLKTKRGRGRPRKNPKATPSKLRHRTRGRPPKIPKEENLEEELLGEFQCETCQEVLPTYSQLLKHARNVHEDPKVHKCLVCSKEFHRANHLKRHMMTHSAIKPYSCTNCTKSFSRRDHLKQHEKQHEKQLFYECDICLKPFSRSDNLIKHKASKHGIGEKIAGVKKYECPICNKVFTTEKYRDIHEKGHSGEKKFQCKTCSKSFLSKSHLTEHMKFHNDHSKKYLCSECGQRFIRNDYLVIHMRRHRGEKPFKCKYCGKGFPRTTDLTVHERYHTGEKTHLCTICGRGFGRAYNLTVHMRTHTGEKPYQCTYCDAAFAQGNDLKAHIRRHTGERFQCELCSDSFLMGYMLTHHKRMVHGLNVVSNIRRLKPVHKLEENSEEQPPIEIPLPKPVVPDNLFAIHNIHLTQIELARD